MTTKAAKGKKISKNIFEDKSENKSNKANPKKRKVISGQYVAIATIPLVLVLGNSMLVPILPDMQEKMGISRFQSSLVITLFSITAGHHHPCIRLFIRPFHTQSCHHPFA